MSSEDLKIIQAETEILRDFPPVAKQSDIQSVCHEVLLSGSRAISYFNNLKEFHIKTPENHIDVKDSFFDDSSKTLITKLQTKEEIESFLLNDKVKNEKNISIPYVNNQISILSSARVNNLGLRLLFSTYIKSVSFMGEFLCNPPQSPEPSTNKKCAEKSIKMLLNTSLPPLFYPVIEDTPKFSLDAPEIIPILPTAIATSDTTVFIGLKGPSIAMIPIQNSPDQKIEVIPIEGFVDEPFSVVYHNGFLIFSSKTMPAFHFDPSTKSAFTLNVFYLTNLLYLKEKMNPFEPPVVTDGSSYYSIEFGPSPKIKVFTQDMDSILFERSFPLKEGTKPLTAPFTELLPLSQKNVAAIATNGIYISFIFRTPAASICRIFLLYTGEHLHDVPLDPTNPITAWAFDTNRPAHFVMREDNIDILNSCFTLPTWLTGYVLPSATPKINSNKNQDVIDGYCNALSIVASRFIGAEAFLNFHLSDQCYRTSMEKAVCTFIQKKNQFAAEAFLVFLAVKMRQEESQHHELTHLLKQFQICFADEEFASFRKLIVYVLFSSFDSFCKADSETTGEILLKVIKSTEYKMLLFKWLPKSKLVTRVLNDDSLKALCDMALKTYYVYDDLALPLLKELQYGFITDPNWKNSSHLFSIYLNELFNQFYSDYNHYLKEDWTLQRFTNCVSFLVFEDLTQIVTANADNIQSTFAVVDIFFRVGSMPRIPGSYTIIQSLYLGFFMAFNLLRKDISFINFGVRPRKESGLEEFKQRLNITNPYVSQEIIDSLVSCAFYSSYANVSFDEIKKNINFVLYKLIKKEITEEELKNKLEEIDKIQPQLFDAIFSYLKGNEIVTYTKPGESPSVWFCSTIAHNLNWEKAENRVIFGMFIPQLFELWQHLAVLPTVYLNTLIHACDLRYYFPAELLRKATNITYSIDDLTIDELRSSFSTLLEICPILSDLSHFIDNFNSYAIIDIFNEKNHEKLLETIFKLRLAIQQKKNVDKIADSLLNFSKQCLFIGNFTIINHIFDIYIFLYQTDFKDIRFLEYCFETIGDYLSLQKFLVAGQGSMFSSVQVIFAIAAFLRKLLMLKLKPAIDALLNLIDQIGTCTDTSVKISKSIAFFAICNNSLELPRPGVQACVTLDNDLKFYGKIKEFDGEENFIFLTNNKKQRQFSKKQSMFTEAINEIVFDVSIFQEKYAEISKIFKEFKEEETFQVPFFLSSLCAFSKEKQFASFIDQSIIDRVVNLISNEFVTSHNAIYELGLLFNSLFSTDPLFSLDSDYIYSQQYQQQLSICKSFGIFHSKNAKQENKTKQRENRNC